MNRHDFALLAESVRQAGRIRRGEATASRVTAFQPTDVQGTRRQLGLTQEEFAHMIGVSIGTLRNWEQGRRVPDGPARALLKVAAADPKAVTKALLG